MPSPPASFPLLLLLLLAVIGATQGKVTVLPSRQLEVSNVDMALSSPPPAYVLTGLAFLRNFDPSRRCWLQPLDAGQQNGTIVLLNATSMEEARCQSFSEVSPQLVEEGFSSLVILTFQYLTGSNGEFDIADQLPSGFILTLVPEGDALLLAQRLEEEGSGTLLLEVTREQGAFETYLKSPGWRAYVWISFAIYMICSLYSMVQIGTTFYNLGFSLTIRLYIFLASTYLGIAHGVVFAAGPWYTTAKLHPVVYNFFWWSGYLFAYWAYCFLLLAWLQTSSFAKQQSTIRRFFVGFNIFSMGYFAVVSIIFIVMNAFPSSPPIRLLFFVLFNTILPIILLVQALIFFASGTKLLRILGVIKQDIQKQNLLRKITVMTYGAVLGFLFFLVTIGLFSLEGNLTWWITTRILAEVGIIVCMVAVFVCLGHYNLNTKTTETGSTADKKVTLTERRASARPEPLDLEHS